MGAETSQRDIQAKPETNARRFHTVHSVATKLKAYSVSGMVASGSIYKTKYNTNNSF
jgi:hypothetical protein